MKKILLKLVESLLLFSAKKLFEYVDKDKSGSLDAGEISAVVSEARNLLTKTMRKAR